MTISFRSLGIVAALAVMLCAMMLCMSACADKTPTAVIDPVDDNNTASTSSKPIVTTTGTTIPTVAVPEHQLDIETLMTIHAPTMYWSDIEGYSHEMTGDNTARFLVADKYGHDCVLEVSIDVESGTLTTAVLSFGDVSENILVEGNQCLLRVLYASNNML